MKIIRFEDDTGATHYAQQHADGSTTLLKGDIANGLLPTNEPIEPGRLVAPIEHATILGIGANYYHYDDTVDSEWEGYPVTYFSLPNAINDPDAEVYLPKNLVHEKTKYEGELVVVIGKTCKNVPVERALSVVFGYSIGNDICTGEWQGENVGGQWSKGKGFDGYKPLGPAIITADEIPDPTRLRVVTTLNGDKVQDESVGRMKFSVQRLIHFLSQGHTLHPGDLIYTGTPQVCPGGEDHKRFLRAGDTVSVTIDEIGTLTNHIVDEP